MHRVIPSYFVVRKALVLGGVSVIVETSTQLVLQRGGGEHDLFSLAKGLRQAFHLHPALVLALLLLLVTLLFLLVSSR